MIEFPQALYVSDNGIERYDAEPIEEVNKDPRGLLLMWEPPIKGVKYIMGGDATEGKTGWTRASRIDGDHKIDNGVLEIFRPDGDHRLLWKEDSDGKKIPDIDPSTNRQRRIGIDIQVAEFAAPCDAVELARIAQVLGTIYAGDEEQCELIWESWPGVGMLMTQELIRLGYSNLWHWEYIVDEVEPTNLLGWRTTPRSKAILWYRCKRHLLKKQIRIRSKFLLDEYSNAEVDPVRQTARAASGFHDDRLMATNLCLWGGHKWAYDVEASAPEVSTGKTPLDFQNRSPECEISYEDGLTVKESGYTSWREKMMEDFEY